VSFMNGTKDGIDSIVLRFCVCTVFHCSRFGLIRTSGGASGGIAACNFALCRSKGMVATRSTRMRS
jgi:hypothetical protein